MIYESNKNIKLRAFQWGVDIAPAWIKKAKTKQKHRDDLTTYLEIEQPKDNTDLACGKEYVMLTDFVVLTDGGSFQVYKQEHFFKMFVSRTNEE
jgi:hypothetical protein